MSTTEKPPAAEQQQAPELKAGPDGQVAISGPGLDHGSAPPPLTHEGAKLKLGGTTIAWEHDDLQPGDHVVLYVEAIVTEAGGKIALGRKHSPTRSWREHVAVVTDARRAETLPVDEQEREAAHLAQDAPTAQDAPAEPQAPAGGGLPDPRTLELAPASSLQPGALCALVDDPDGDAYEWGVVDARLTDDASGHVRVAINGTVYEFEATEKVAYDDYIDTEDDHG